MEKIRRIIVDEDIINLKKDFLGYRIVHPIRNDDGTFNTFNFITGGWRNLITLIIILTIIGVALYGFMQVTDSCRDLAENPCDYFPDLYCQENQFDSGFYNGIEIEIDLAR